MPWNNISHLARFSRLRGSMVGDTRARAVAYLDGIHVGPTPRGVVEEDSGLIIVLLPTTRRVSRLNGYKSRKFLQCCVGTYATSCALLAIPLAILILDPQACRD